MAERGIGPRRSTRIVRPHRERDGVMVEGVVAWGAVRIRVQEALALLRSLLESVPLRLPLCPCGPQTESEIKH